MKLIQIPITLLFFCLIILALSSCSDIIEPSINKSTVNLEAPVNNYQSTSYTVNFWWDQVTDALSYHLQVVSLSFGAPGGLVLDTIVTRNKFSFNFNPGNYQWRVMAENGSSQTANAPPRSFTVAASSIKQQSVQLTSPANSLLTNVSKTQFQWGSLYGATQYRFEIDTNNFVNEATVISNQVIPGQKLNFTLPKDQTYQWRIRAENDTAQSQWSAINLLIYDHTPPAQVILGTPINGATVNLPVTLQWNPTATANHYKLFVFQSDSTTLYNSTFPLVVNSTSYSFNLGTSGNRMYWKVSAVDAAGNEGQASLLQSFVLQ